MFPPDIHGVDIRCRHTVWTYGVVRVAADRAVSARSVFVSAAAAAAAAAVLAAELAAVL